MNRKNFALDDNFNRIPKMLLSSKQDILFKVVMRTILSSNPDDIVKQNYLVDGKQWVVYHGPTFKMTIEATDFSYHCFFSKLDGINIRFGKTVDEDPEYCALGPEILDLEISVNGCVPVPGSCNCRYCYKNNTNAAPTNMSFETFTEIVRRFPINLSQIAFGITGLSTNPDFGAMLKYCRDIGIIPNLTTVGADLNDKVKDEICHYAGAIAVSCYVGAKEHCYKTIKEIHAYAKEKYNRDIHVNMHIVLSKGTFEHLKDVLNDIKEQKVEGLNAVVLLRIKPKGRAENLDCKVSKEMYKDVIDFCLKNDIKFGFDSCSAVVAAEVLEAYDKKYVSCCEPCESSRFSSYINVKGEYWSCSFAENHKKIQPINVLSYDSVSTWWNSAPLNDIRLNANPASRSCALYDLDD